MHPYRVNRFLLVPACNPRADVGFIVLQPDQAHAMSGANAMCATTALLETGMVPMVEPESRVTLDMPPAFVARQDPVIETTEWGAVRYDLCFGGVFYALVDAGQIGPTIAPENARALAMTGWSHARSSGESS